MSKNCSSRLTVDSSPHATTGGSRTARDWSNSHLAGITTAHLSLRMTAVPISFTIEPISGLLRTVVTGRFSRDEAIAYANELRAHQGLDRVERRLVDVRPSALISADELLDVLVLEHDVAGSIRRTDRRAILLNSDAGPALGRELVVADRRHSGIPISYRVFRSAAHAYRYLRVEPRLVSDRTRIGPRRAATES